MNTEDEKIESDCLILVWQKLAAVSSLRFEATSGDIETGWSGAGQGTVTVERFDDVTMLFHESGKWSNASGREFGFSNVYRWSLLNDTGSLRLEHLRFGNDRPVYLFELRPEESGEWKSVEPHVCSEDCYTAEMQVESAAIHLRWKIAGPTKNETIAYWYQ